MMLVSQLAFLMLNLPQQDDVKQIRKLIDDWAAGMRAKDAKRVKRHGTKDLVHFSFCTLSRISIASRRIANSIAK